MEALGAVYLAAQEQEFDGEGQVFIPENISYQARFPRSLLAGLQLRCGLQLRRECLTHVVAGYPVAAFFSQEIAR